MATTLVGQPKRHRSSRPGERRVQRDAGSSRDASEEDNDEGVSDVGSLVSVPPGLAGTHSVHASSSKPATSGASSLHAANTAAAFPPRKSGSILAQRRVEELSGEGSQSEGLDSPTYDGDVESSSTVGGTPTHLNNLDMPFFSHQRRPSSPTPYTGEIDTDIAGQMSNLSPVGQRIPTPKPSIPNLSGVLSTSPLGEPEHYSAPHDVPVARSNSLAEPRRSQTLPLSNKPSKSDLGPPKMMTRPKELPLEDIRGFVQRAIEGRGEEDGEHRWWKTNAAPEGKVVRVYADGVYDLFHFGHALQLRQAKLSFPQVQLLVGVCSDVLCAQHKSAPVMTHAERCESVRHCRWADEILPDAPWVVDQSWLEKHQIDYIAHDEFVYPSKEYDDVYAFAKEQGRFVPTRRTPAISTSDLLERIVRGYRDGFFDSKLEKNGLSELLASDVDWDSSPRSKQPKFLKSPAQ